MYPCAFLESWNVAAFEFIHGGLHTAPLWVLAAGWLAEWPVYIAVALVLWHLVRKRDGATAIMIVFACACARLAELAMSTYAYHARPFAAGFGPALVSHAANNSMPSSHTTFVWTLAAAMAVRRQWTLAMILAVLGLLLAWARVFVGIHWPFDMVGAAIVAVICACLGRLLLGLWGALARRMR